MKRFTILFLFLVTPISYAGVGGDSGSIGGDCAMAHVGERNLFLDVSMVEALVSNDGTYARLDDLREGFEYFDGAEIGMEKVSLDVYSQELDVDYVIFSDGDEVSVESLFITSLGGDMGGGGN